MLKIAIYGKGGIGKSTTVSNLSVTFRHMGYRVMQIGCDPKADSTCNLHGGKRVPTVLDSLRENEDVELERIVTEGVEGVLCVEAGGPLPGIGCAGRGIITAFEKLDELNAYEVYQPDIVLYDVLGDVVCGGFAMPIRNGYADHVAIVTSGEMMALYAASNIAHALQNLGRNRKVVLSGLILNARNVENEDELVLRAAREIGTDILSKIPRDALTQQAEAQGTTVAQLFPDSQMANEYRTLAHRLLEVCQGMPCRIRNGAGSRGMQGCKSPKTRYALAYIVQCIPHFRCCAVPAGYLHWWWGCLNAAVIAALWWIIPEGRNGTIPIFWRTAKSCSDAVKVWRTRCARWPRRAVRMCWLYAPVSLL